MLTRRGLFGRLLGAVGAAIAAPWLPKAAAPARLMRLTDPLSGLSIVPVTLWQDYNVAFEWNSIDAAIGDTVRLRLPQRFQAQPLGARARRRQKRLTRT